MRKSEAALMLENKKGKRSLHRGPPSRTRRCGSLLSLSGCGGAVELHFLMSDMPTQIIQSVIVRKIQQILLTFGHTVFAMMC